MFEIGNNVRSIVVAGATGLALCSQGGITPSSPDHAHAEERHEVFFDHRWFADVTASHYGRAGTGVIGCRPETITCQMINHEGQTGSIDLRAIGRVQINGVVGGRDPFILARNIIGEPYRTGIYRVSGVGDGPKVEPSRVNDLNVQALHVDEKAGLGYVLETVYDGNFPPGYKLNLTVVDTKLSDLPTLSKYENLRGMSGAVVGSVLDTLNKRLIVSYDSGVNGETDKPNIAVYDVSDPDKIVRIGREITSNLNDNLIPKVLVGNSLISLHGKNPRAIELTDISSQNGKAKRVTVETSQDVVGIVPYGSEYIIVATSTELIPYSVKGGTIKRVGDEYGVDLKSRIISITAVNGGAVVAMDRGVEFVAIESEGSNKVFMPISMVETPHYASP